MTKARRVTIVGLAGVMLAASILPSLPAVAWDGGGWGNGYGRYAHRGWGGGWRGGYGPGWGYGGAVLGGAALGALAVGALAGNPYRAGGCMVDEPIYDAWGAPIGYRRIPAPCY